MSSSRAIASIDKDVADLGSNARGIAADIGDLGAAEVVADAVDAEFGGRLNGVVINADDLPPGRPWP